MIREYTKHELVKKTIKERHCDVCDNVIKWNLECSVAKCELCKKDLCEKRVAHEEPTMGDYREVYCASCMEIKNKYYQLIKPHEDEIEKLNEQMINECKNTKIKK